MAKCGKRSLYYAYRAQDCWVKGTSSERNPVVTSSQSRDSVIHLHHQFIFHSARTSQFVCVGNSTSIAYIGTEIENKHTHTRKKRNANDLSSTNATIEKEHTKLIRFFFCCCWFIVIVVVFPGWENKYVHKHRRRCEFARKQEKKKKYLAFAWNTIQYNTR